MLVAAIAATALASLAGSRPEVDLTLLAVVALLCAAGNLFEIFMPAHWSFQPNMMFFFAAAILLPPWAIAALAIVCFLPGYAVNRKSKPDRFPWYKVAFNVANYLLAGLAAHEIASAGQTMQEMSDAEVGPVLQLAAAAIVFALINHMLIIAAVWQAGERSLAAAARQLRDGLPLDTALCLTGACFAVVWDIAPAAVVLSPGPALLVYRALRAPLLARDAAELRDEVGALQTALLPRIPPQVGGLAVSVAYRPAEGPAAGGDFYDVLELDHGRVAIILGDVSGHGRDALGRSALMRYTMRAYLEAGLSPRAALRVANEALHNELGDDFATVVVAVHDPHRGALTYASAGHPPPVVLAPDAIAELTTCCSPPIGLGEPTGLRQTTVPAPVGATICLYTDGLADASLDGVRLGFDGVARELALLGGDATAGALVRRLARNGNVGRDDMAVCLLRVTTGPSRAARRVEELECSAEELDTDLPVRFLASCGFAPGDAEEAVARLRDRGERGALLRILFDGHRPRLDASAGGAGTTSPLRRRRGGEKTTDEPTARFGADR